MHVFKTMLNNILKTCSCIIAISNGIKFHNWGEATKKNVMYIHNCRLAILYRTGQARLIIIVDSNRTLLEGSLDMLLHNPLRYGYNKTYN